MKQGFLGQESSCRWRKVKARPLVGIDLTN